MDSASDLGEDSGTQALQETDATVNQPLGMLQLLGATSPLEALKAAGLAGVSFSEDRAKGPPTLSHSDRLAQDTAKLKRLADQQRSVKKQADELEEVIRRQQAKLSSLHSALATLEKDYADTVAACAPAGAKRTADMVGAPPLESIHDLEGISKVFDDGTHMDAAYNVYVAQCEGTQTQPEPPALWISKAATAEIAKVKALLMKYQSEQTAPKKRHVASGGADAQL